MDILPTRSRPSQVSTPTDAARSVTEPERGPSGGPWGRRLGVAAVMLGAAVLVRRLGPNGTGDDSAGGDATTVDDATGRRTRTEEPSDDDGSNDRLVRLATVAVAASAVGYLARRWQR